MGYCIWAGINDLLKKYHDISCPCYNTIINDNPTVKKRRDKEEY